VTLQPRSPNLNAHCEGCIKSIKTEALSKMVLFGEASLPHVLTNYVDYHHSERNHQGKGNLVLFPKPADRIGESSGQFRTRERLGGLLKFYH
jgi:putative transposase